MDHGAEASRGARRTASTEESSEQSSEQTRAEHSSAASRTARGSIGPESQGFTGVRRRPSSDGSNK